jgi:class 3 adenylate cyclase
MLEPCFNRRGKILTRCFFRFLLCLRRSTVHLTKLPSAVAFSRCVWCLAIQSNVCCFVQLLADLPLSFQVETVGDCYVAVTGLPDPRKDHAVAMARFARDCMQRARALTKKLEVTLGPDTGDLTMRAGLHSGPVTAGVLRGERSRFQLFGGTYPVAIELGGCRRIAVTIVNSLWP